MAILELFLLVVLYILPMVGSWYHIITMMIKEPPKKSDHWMIWLGAFASIIPAFNIAEFIFLTYAKHNL